MTASGNGPVAPRAPPRPRRRGDDRPADRRPDLRDAAPATQRCARPSCSSRSSPDSARRSRSAPTRLFAQIDEASETVGERSLVCWNAVEVDAQTDCTKPKGVRGLRWSSRPSAPASRTASTRSTSTRPSVARRCGPARWRRRPPVEITYSHHHRAVGSQATPSACTTATPRACPARTAAATGSPGRSNSSATVTDGTEMFLKRPFSVTVSATERDAVAVLRDRVRIASRRAPAAAERLTGPPPELDQAPEHLSRRRPAAARRRGSPRRRRWRPRGRRRSARCGRWLRRHPHGRARWRRAASSRR